MDAFTLVANRGSHSVTHVQVTLSDGGAQGVGTVMVKSGDGGIQLGSASILAVEQTITNLASA